MRHCLVIGQPQLETPYVRISGMYKNTGAEDIDKVKTKHRGRNLRKDKRRTSALLVYLKKVGQPWCPP